MVPAENTGMFQASPLASCSVLSGGTYLRERTMETYSTGNKQVTEEKVIRVSTLHALNRNSRCRTPSGYRAPTTAGRSSLSHPHPQTQSNGNRIFFGLSKSVSFLPSRTPQANHMPHMTSRHAIPAAEAASPGRRSGTKRPRDGSRGGPRQGAVGRPPRVPRDARAAGWPRWGQTRTMAAV